MRIPMLLLAFYVTVPIGDWPGLGLSLSAPLAALIIAETLLGPSGVAPRPWTNLTLLLWTGLAASLVFGLLSGAFSQVATDELVLLLRFGYWGGIFLAAATLLSRAGWTRQVAAAMGLGVGALGVLRLAEAARDGVWGSGNPQWLSQNDYGFGFSTFTPFLLWTAVAGPQPAGWIAAALTPLTLLAAAGNGSRSSWIAVTIGALGLLTIAVLAGRVRMWPVAVASVAAVLLVSVGGVRMAASSGDLLAGPKARWDSLSRLEHDKPFRTRLLLIDKGWELFGRSPWFGVGLGRFTKESAEPTGLAAAEWLDRDQFNQRTPHNAYIKILAETGLAGTLPLALLLGLLAWRGPRAAVRLARRGESWAAPAVAAGAGMSLHLWTMSGLTGTGPWVVLGVIAAVVERDRLRSEEAR